MIRVLMIEDDVELAEILAEYLAQFSIEVTNVEDPYMGLAKLDTETFDLVILDLTLPGMDGLDLCKKISERSDIPIIISSARSDITDKVIGLERGADDYLPKPYNPRELEARIRSVLRRRRPKEEADRAKLSEIALDDEKMQITLCGEPLHLTMAEYGILSYLIKHEDRVISREELIYNVEAISEESGAKSIDVIVSRIRHKLEEDPKHPRHILSVRGVGYKFAP